MTDIKMPSESWVVVCDGAKALIMQNAGDNQNINLKVQETLTQPNIADRDLGADKPGRGHQANGTTGSAVEETSWHDQAEADFLKSVAQKLEILVRDKEARHIVLVAPPKALGQIRPNLNAATQSAISAEVAKDLTHFPVDQIERHLTA